MTGRNAQINTSEPIMWKNIAAVSTGCVRHDWSHSTMASPQPVSSDWSKESMLHPYNHVVALRNFSGFCAISTTGGRWVHRWLVGDGYIAGWWAMGTSLVGGRWVHRWLVGDGYIAGWWAMGTSLVDSYLNRKV